MKRQLPIIMLLVALPWLSSTTQAEEPALPSGLGSLPELPSGLGSDSNENWDEEDSEESNETWQINGFADARIGAWLHNKTYQGRHPLAETRLNINAERTYDALTVAFSADLLYDNAASEQHPNIEEGQGWLDLRAANLTFSPQDFMDIKIGRQTLTWGTGDLIFINDLFPKDWNAFLIGRDNTYLKAPSDAIKASLFSQAVNLDLIYTPRFDSDRYINGERAAYYNADLKQIAGTNAIIIPEKPSQWFKDDEIAVRLYQNIGAMELALYGYQGYWKSPAGMNATTGKAIFPRLHVYGASLRNPLFGGIANAEMGYYDSKDDPAGNNPLINNSEFRVLLGYEHELIRDITLAMQLYSTIMLNHHNYLREIPATIPALKRERHEVTSRFTWVLFEQKLISTLYLRYSPTDKDYYIRPKLHYSVNDHWSYELGGNFFGGKQPHTFFGQFSINDNVYAALRYGL